MTRSELDDSDRVSDVSSLHSPSLEHSRPEGLTPRGHLQAPVSGGQHEFPNPTVSTQSFPQTQKQEDSASSLGLARPLERHSLGVWLMLIYATAATFSWVVICVLSYRPIGMLQGDGTTSTYYDQSAGISRVYYQNSSRWMQAANVISAAVSAIGIPVTSAICATATAVYCQKSSDVSRPSLTLRQTLALADKGWSDFGVLRNMIWPSRSRKTRSGLLLVSTGLVVLGKFCCLYLCNPRRLMFPEQPSFYLFYRVLRSKLSTSKSRALKTTNKLWDNLCPLLEWWKRFKMMLFHP